MKQFTGSIVALVTPFTSKGRIDWKALASLVAWHIEEKTDGIVCCGTTGEGFSLTREERKKVVQLCVSEAAGKIPIIAGSGTCNTQQSIQYTKDAQKMGADGCLVVTPYYCRPSQRGCLEHFRQVAKVGLPVIVYHNPSRAVFKFTLDSILELEKIPGIAAIKDSSHDLDLIRKMIAASKLPIISGDCDLTFEIIQAGGVGAISVVGNVIPRGWSRMVHAALAKEFGVAKKLAQRYLPLCLGHFIESNPQCVKFVLSQMGKCLPDLRLPLAIPSIETQRALKKLLVELGLYFYGRDRRFSGRMDL